MRSLICSAFLILCSCAASPEEVLPLASDGTVHFAPLIGEGPWLRCMAQDGAWADANVQWGSEGRTCKQPDRFVATAPCLPGQKPANEPQQARLIAARDHSIIGDTYGGLPMCSMPPPF